MELLTSIKRLIVRKSQQFSPISKEYFSIFSLVFIAVAIRLRNLDSPVTGSYTFRTTQTAWGIRSVANGIVSPFSIETPVLGAPWKIPFEFPLYQMIAGFLSRFLGTSVESSARLVSILFFILSGYVLHRVGRIFFSSGVCILILAIFLFNAHNLEYGSSVLIEYCAMFFSLAGFYFAIRFCQSYLRKYLYLFFVFGTVAALVKVTTSIVWIGLGTLIAVYLNRTKLKSSLLVIIVAGMAHIPTLMWTMWADNQKSKTFYTEWLASKNLNSWTFGSVKQRFSFSDWNQTISNIFVPSVLGSPIIVFALLVIALSLAKNRKLSAAFIGLFVAGPLIFTNLYFVHEYYWTVVLPALLLSLAPGIELIADLLRKATGASSKRLATLGLLVGTFLVMTSWFNEYGKRSFDVFIKPGSVSYIGEQYGVAVEEISSLTTTKDQLIVIGSDWDPTLLYFADRRGLMILDRWDPMKIVKKSQFGNEYKFIYAFPPGAFDIAQLQERFHGVNLVQVGKGLFRIAP